MDSSGCCVQRVADDIERTDTQIGYILVDRDPVYAGCIRLEHPMLSAPDVQCLSIGTDRQAVEVWFIQSLIDGRCVLCDTINPLPPDSDEGFRTVDRVQGDGGSPSLKSPMLPVFPSIGGVV